MMIKETSRPYHFLQLIGNRVRWQLVLSLAKSDLSVQELVDRVKSPQNVVSYHLKLLKEGNLISEHQSISDGREIFYRLNFSEISAQFKMSAMSIHPALITGLEVPFAISGCRILIVCTHNSARSQMAEGIFRAKISNHIQVDSAGTQPLEVHPLAIQALKELQIDISNQRAKPLDAFLDKEYDYVITVCDRARDTCPVFRGSPETIHWSIPDPIETSGSDEDRLAAFRAVANDLSVRIDYFLARISAEQRFTSN